MGNHTGWSQGVWDASLHCPCIVHRVTEEVVAIHHKVIYLPQTAEDQMAVPRGFAGLAGHRAFFKSCRIDQQLPCQNKATKRPWWSLPQEQQIVLFHHPASSLWPSGPLCGHVRGLAGVGAWLRVIRHSSLYRHAIYPPPGHFILADGGYSCLQHPLPFITSYKRSMRGLAAQRFNVYHSRARIIFERAFGIMKTRFGSIFLKALEVHHTFVPQVSSLNRSLCLFLSRVNQT